MPRGRRIDHYDVGQRHLAVDPERFRHREDPEQLVETGRGQVNEIFDDDAVVGRIEAGAAPERLEDRVDRLEVAPAARGEEGRRVDLAHAQARRRAGHRRGLVADVGVEDVGERVRRISGEE